VSVACGAALRLHHGRGPEKACRSRGCGRQKAPPCPWGHRGRSFKGARGGHSKEFRAWRCARASTSLYTGYKGVEATGVQASTSLRLQLYEYSTHESHKALHQSSIPVF
jgi:hypothetical protein